MGPLQCCLQQGTHSQMSFLLLQHSHQHTAGVVPGGKNQNHESRGGEREANRKGSKERPWRPGTWTMPLVKERKFPFCTTIPTPNWHTEKALMIICPRWSFKLISTRHCIIGFPFPPGNSQRCKTFFPLDSCISRKLGFPGTVLYYLKRAYNNSHPTDSA